MKPLKSFGLLLLLLCLCTSSLLAQSQSIGGRITDERNRQPVAFVNVVVNDGLTGTMSDIDGKYEITASEPIRKISFSCIGYSTKNIELQTDTNKLNIMLTPITIELGEVTVEAGENPAHRIIDSVMAHRKANNPNSLDSYKYKIYDQMVFTVDSTEWGNAILESSDGVELKRFDSILEKSDLMVMETASEVLFKSPDRKLQNVLGTKIAGMKNPTFFYLVNSMQSISFYDESIHVVGKDYVNPISRGSKRHYFFTLESVSPIGHGDSLYVITFHPMRGSTFNGLRGTLTVNSDGWALQSVKAEPNEQDAGMKAGIQQLYQKVGGQWFPIQLNTNIKFPGLAIGVDGNTLTMVAIGKSYLTDIEINPKLSKRRFSDIEIMVDPDAGFRDDSFWNAHRIDSLTERIRATYFFVDSLTGGTDILDRVMGVTAKLMNESALPLGPVNLDLGHLLKYSVSRGWGFGLGLSTNNRFSRCLRLSGFVGYWPRPDFLDYGATIGLRLNPQRQIQLDLRVANTSDAIGSFGDLAENGGLLSDDNYKYTFYENVYSRHNRAELQFTSRFARHFKGFAIVGMSHKRYLEQFYINPADTVAQATFATAELKLRFAYKEKFLSNPDGLQSLGTLYPIVWLSYMHSFPNILGSRYEFDRIRLQATQYIYTPYAGVSKITLQAGLASEGCPVMEAFDLLGTYQKFGLYSPGSFATMRFDEFFCDRFAALYLSHNFSGMLWKTQSPWFKPELTLATHLGWGDMKRSENHPEKNFKTMEKGFFESGFVVNGLLATPYTKIGAGVFYRYGPYAFERVWDNFAWKWYTTFSF